MQKFKNRRNAVAVVFQMLNDAVTANYMNMPKLLQGQRYL